MMQNLWNNWYFHDVLVGGLVILMAWIYFSLNKREYWRAAFHKVFQRKTARVSFVILCLYTSIALLDSIGLHPQLRDDQGVTMKDPLTGSALVDQEGLSILDVILTPLRKAKEKTYSAPLAMKQFTKETMIRDGKKVRDYPALAHSGKHLLGTDRVGNDVMYQALKGIRTGMIIGGFTMIIVIPLAVLFGVISGYLGGLMDDAIQYIYTVLASIPSILLIAAFMVTANEDSSRLARLCIILGITSWTGLCRVLRGETLKLREMEYVQASRAMGVSPVKIMYRHITPNLMHVALITAVLGFSGRVLSEVILTYIGIGVGSDTISWGVMINDALREIARDPMIWWKLFAAFIFMIGLVLPANLFGDALRDALDPRLRTE